MVKVGYESIAPDPYYPAVAKNLNNMRVIAEIMSRTLKLHEEQQKISDSTDFEQNFQLVNILL